MRAAAATIITYASSGDMEREIRSSANATTTGSQYRIERIVRLYSVLHRLTEPRGKAA
jgi:hypothetical protein